MLCARLQDEEGLSVSHKYPPFLHHGYDLNSFLHQGSKATDMSRVRPSLLPAARAEHPAPATTLAIVAQSCWRRRHRQRGDASLRPTGFAARPTVARRCGDAVRPAPATVAGAGRRAGSPSIALTGTHLTINRLLRCLTS